MLKWLKPKSVQTEIVTDDPLATIRVNKADRPLEIYAVSRVNPIFDEEEEDRSKASETLPQKPDSPSKSASSGYGSNRYNSSECSSGAEDATEEAPRPVLATLLRDDALTVLEQNVGFVKSILVAVRSSPKRPGRLAPIPEGKVDYCIPRPVWPRDDRPAPPPDSLVDDALLLYTSLTFTPPAEDRGASQEVLKELSDTISQVLDGTQSTPPGDVLEGLTNTINRSLERLHKVPKAEGASTKLTPTSPKSMSSKFEKSVTTEEAIRRLSLTLSHSRHLTRTSDTEDAASGSEEALRRLSLTLSHSRHLAKMTRALSHSSEEATPASSSSSAASSSGFSSDPSSGAPPPVFVHEDLASANNSVRNAILFGKAGGAYEKLLGAAPKAEADVKNEQWENYLGAGVTAGDVRLKSKPEHFYYPPGDRPDFTLDIPRAERLLRKIRQAKQRRFWCRLVTSLLGLIFFLLSVMVVSMLLTRGKRIFGPL